MENLVVNKTAEAREDIISIWDYIYDKEDGETADDVVNFLIEKMAYLSDFPFLGVERDNIQKGLRFLTARNYSIFYKVKGNEVDIIRVLYGSRETRSIF